MRSGRVTYLNEQLVAMTRAKKNIQIVVGGILSIFFIFKMAETVLGHTDRKYIPVYLLFLLPSLHLLFCGIRIGTLLKEAKRFEMIFSKEPDGIITIEELSEYTGLSEHKIRGDLGRIIRKGYLKNCTLKSGDQPYVIMSADDDQNEYINRNTRKKSNSPQTR